LAEYVGEYASEELLNATHRCAIEKDHLILTFRGGRSAPLIAMAKDEFSLGEFGLEFIRVGEKVIGVRLNCQRAVGIEFERICDKE